MRSEGHGDIDARRIVELQREYLFPCVATMYQEPIVAIRGQGMRVTDAEGTDYLDFFGGIVTVSVGHCNESVAGAVVEQNRTLQHVSTLYVTEPQVRLAEKLAEVTPDGLKKSFFTNSGTEANETAVLLARRATGRSDVIALRHGYSGRSETAQNLTAHAQWRSIASSVSYVKHAHNAYCYRCAFGLTYPACDLRCAKDVEELIQTTTNGEIAAFLAEPIQGVGGYVVPPKEYFEEVLRIVRKYGGLFICDEVQSGLGRTGTAFCGIEHWGVQPDIITFAKGLGNGLPIGATVASTEAADSLTGLSISTFGGNPVSCRAALATIDYIEQHDLISNAHIQGNRLREGLEELQDKYMCIGDVRGLGLMMGLEIVDTGSAVAKAPDAEKAGVVLEAARRLGLLVGKGGLYGNVVRLTPPLIVDASDVDEALGILERAFAEAC